MEARGTGDTVFLRDLNGSPGQWERQEQVYNVRAAYGIFQDGFVHLCKAHAVLPQDFVTEMTEIQCRHLNMRDIALFSWRDDRHCMSFSP